MPAEAAGASEIEHADSGHDANRRSDASLVGATLLCGTAQHDGVHDITEHAGPDGATRHVAAEGGHAGRDLPRSELAERPRFFRDPEKAAELRCRGDLRRT